LSKPEDPPTILFPAVTHPHKRHVLIVEAFHLLAARHPSVRLLLTGGAGRAEADVRRAIDAGPHADRIDRVGRIPADALAKRLSASTVVAFPSSYEGFGIPVVEAMAVGVPVLVADGTPAADLTGPASVLPAMAGPSQWADRLERLLFDDDHRRSLIAEGLAGATAHTWEASAVALERAWRLLLSAGPWTTRQGSGAR